MIVNTLKICNAYKVLKHLLDIHNIPKRERATVVKGRQFSNRKLEENEEQKQAVLNIINKTSFPAHFILYGPPGTGKTTTIIESIRQLVKLKFCTIKNKILICTPSNNAADLITIKLLETEISKDIIRLYAKTYEKTSVSNQIHAFSNIFNKNTSIHQLIDDKKIIICTLCYCARLTLYKVEKISYVFIDEAGQARETETLIPLTLEGDCHITLAGDPQQLGPVVKSHLAKKILNTLCLENS